MWFWMGMGMGRGVMAAQLSIDIVRGARAKAFSMDNLGGGMYIQSGICIQAYWVLRRTDSYILYQQSVER